MTRPRTIDLEDATPTLLASEVLARSQRHGDRYVVGIAGIPGSGKSTLARHVVDELSKRLGPRGGAVLVPMDGFHLSNARLKQLGLSGRKGAPETFDAAAYIRLLENAKRLGGSLCFPIYDRTVHEPVLRDDDRQRIFAETRIIVTEGNYLLLDDEPWRELAAVLDECWWLETSIETAQRWIIDRHVRGGKPPEQARAHYEAVDRPNAALAMSRRRRPDVILQRPPLSGR